MMFIIHEFIILVLNVIPSFSLSFLKVRVKVWKSLVRIQRRFLLSGVKGDAKFYWVKWSDVYKYKKIGGL